MKFMVEAGREEKSTSGAPRDEARAVKGVSGGEESTYSNCDTSHLASSHSLRLGPLSLVA